VMLSARAKHFHDSQLEYLNYVWRKPAEEFYHPTSNPQGIAVLTVAENTLTTDLLLRKLKDIPQPPKEVFSYGRSFQLQQAVARLFEATFFKGRKLDPKNFVITNGAGPAVNMLMSSLCDPGDGAIVPSPYYPGFDPDLKLLGNVHPIPAPMKSSENFKLDIGAIDHAYEKAKTENIEVKCLLISSPNNPLGCVCTREELILIWQWAVKHKVHLIMDEIYALSCFDSEHPFVSMSDVLLEHNEDFGQYIHVVWSFSKDFDMSGFRVGVVYTENEELLASLQNQSYMFLSSNLSQFVLCEMLSDELFVTEFINTNKQNLHHSYESLATTLKSNRISFIPANAGFFVMLDLRKYLPEPSFQAEMTLWRKLVDDCHLVFTPGSSMHCDEAGWFRCCYAGYEPQNVHTMIVKLADYLKQIN